MRIKIDKSSTSFYFYGESLIVISSLSKCKDSILVHELIHYLDDKIKILKPVGRCEPEYLAYLIELVVGKTLFLNRESMHLSYRYYRRIERNSNPRYGKWIRIALKFPIYISIVLFLYFKNRRIIRKYEA